MLGSFSARGLNNILSVMLTFWRSLDPVTVGTFLGLVLISKMIGLWTQGIMKCVPSPDVASFTPANLTISDNEYDEIKSSELFFQWHWSGQVTPTQFWFYQQMWCDIDNNWWQPYKPTHLLSHDWPSLLYEEIWERRCCYLSKMTALWPPSTL